MKLFITFNTSAATLGNEIVIDAVYASKEKYYVFAHQGDNECKARYEVDLNVPEGMTNEMPVEMYGDGMSREWFMNNVDCVLDDASSNTVFYAQDSGEGTARLNSLYAQLSQLHCCYFRPGYQYLVSQSTESAAITPYIVEVESSESGLVSESQATGGDLIAENSEEFSDEEFKSEESDSQEAVFVKPQEVDQGDADNKNEVVAQPDKIVDKLNREFSARSQKQGYFSQQSLLRGALFFGAAVTVGVVAIAVDHSKAGVLKI